MLPKQLEADANIKQIMQCNKTTFNELKSNNTDKVAVSKPKDDPELDLNNNEIDDLIKNN